MKITLLGSGNVATHLGNAFKKAGHEIVEVYSRTIQNANLLAGQFQAKGINNISSLSDKADLYVVSVSDDRIAELIAQLPFEDKVVIHTSGTTELTISGISGVFYPVQTFSKQRPVNFKTVPIAIEGKDGQVVKQLLELAGSISTRVIQLNSEQRRALHVAAVFACNFTNHFYTIADSILQNKGLHFDLIRPLITETAQKVQDDPPSSVQTGPAMRNDQTTIKKHLEFLKNNPDLRELYERLSQSIINF